MQGGSFRGKVEGEWQMTWEETTTQVDSETPATENRAAPPWRLEVGARATAPGEAWGLKTGGTAERAPGTSKSPRCTLLLLMSR